MVKIRNSAPAWDNSDPQTAPTMLNQMGKEKKTLEAEGSRNYINGGWCALRLTEVQKS